MQHLHPNFTLQGGKYKIEKVLGQGGFGITYLAYNNYENKYVAIKEFFLKELCGREESTHRVVTHIDTTTIERFKAKFLKEARTLMSFTHRNIVQVFDCFEENNTAYYVMEYIQGSSISEILRQHGSLDERTAVNYIRKVAAALQYIHGMHINHLDVKPGNILLRSQDNEIVLIDFGTAKHYDTATGGATTMTQAGYSQGYAAIEQYHQGGVSTFTPETDIYSLGATLYKMLTSQTPQEPSLIIEKGLPTMPSWISQSTKSAITAAMQINKQNRPHSISEFLQILDEDETTKVVGDETRVNSNIRKGSNRPTPPPPARNLHKNNRTSWGWIVAIIVAVVGGIVWHGSNQRSSEGFYESAYETSSLSNDYLPKEQSYSENHDQEIKDFIHFFYSAYVFGSYNFDTSTVSSSVLRRLQNDYDYDDGGYAVWDFRTGAQDGPDGESRITSVTAEGNGWYKVTMLDCGVNGVKRVKVDYNNGNMKIVDFR